MRSGLLAIEWLESRSMTDANFGALMFMASPFSPTEGTNDHQQGAEVAPINNEIYGDHSNDMLQIGAGGASPDGGMAFIPTDGAAADAAFVAGAAAE